MCTFEYFLEIGKLIIRDSTGKQEMNREVLGHMVPSSAAGCWYELCNLTSKS